MLDGRAVFVTHVGSQFGQQLASALGELGARVTTAETGFDDRETAEAALAAATHLDVLVHVVVDDAAFVAQPLAETAPASWDEHGEALVRDALFTFQAAHARFAPAGTGRVVVVAPTAGLTGARGFVPYTTAIEGVRALAKSTARQWGPQAITVNTVLVPPALVSPVLADATSFDAPPVVGRLPDLRDDIAATVAHFAAPTSSGITGATVIVDGGSVIAP